MNKNSFTQPLETYLSCEQLPEDACGKFTSPLTNYRWKERKYEDGIKWKFLEHRGPLFAPAYDPLPDDVKFYYNGNCLLDKNIDQKVLMSCVMSSCALIVSL